MLTLNYCNTKLDRHDSIVVPSSNIERAIIENAIMLYECMYIRGGTFSSFFLPKIFRKFMLFLLSEITSPLYYKLHLKLL